jgi:aminopeptidase-like protein
MSDEAIARFNEVAWLAALLDEKEVMRTGEAMHRLLSRLFPICRSITGPGVRETLAHLTEVVPLSISEIPTGTPVFDWTVPREWSIEEAYIEHEDGKRYVDFRDNSLHVVGYSTPVDQWMALDELLPRLHSLPQHPDWVPFRTSYYKQDWGFCLSEKVRQALPAGRYHVVINSRLYDGSLTIGEHLHMGESDDEVLVFAHTCHPSLANDNLSGIVIAAWLAAFLGGRPTRYSYRFIFAPATIGSIAWMAHNEPGLHRIRHGLVLAMLGNDGPLRYQRTCGGNAIVDRAAAAVLRSRYPGSQLLDFSPWGFDERQFNSAGIRLPVGRLTRALPGHYPPEHTSADMPAAVSPAALGEAWRACLHIFDVLECDRRYVNLAPKGEPQLGRRGIYRQTGGHYDGVPERQLALLWLLNQCDGSKSLLDVAEHSGLDIQLVAHCALELQQAGLLEATL